MLALSRPLIQVQPFFTFSLFFLCRTLKECIEELPAVGRIPLFAQFVCGSTEDPSTATASPARNMKGMFARFGMGMGINSNSGSGGTSTGSAGRQGVADNNTASASTLGGSSTAGSSTGGDGSGGASSSKSNNNSGSTTTSTTTKQLFDTHAAMVTLTPRFNVLWRAHEQGK